MNKFWKNLFRFFVVSILWCSFSINRQFWHELSREDWISHILYSILFALVYMFLEWRYKDKKGKNKEQEKEK
jgi:hypothetical protein